MLSQESQIRDKQKEIDRLNHGFDDQPKQDSSILKSGLKAEGLITPGILRLLVGGFCHGVGIQ